MGSSLPLAQDIKNNILRRNILLYSFSIVLIIDVRNNYLGQILFFPRIHDCSNTSSAKNKLIMIPITIIFYVLIDLLINLLIIILYLCLVCIVKLLFLLKIILPKGICQ